MVERVHPLRSQGATNVDCAAVRLTALPPAARFSVRAGPVVAAEIGATLGVALGSAACRASVAGEKAALWLGPDEWLVLAPDDTAPPIAADRPASVVDVSHRSTAIGVSGARAAWTINAFCALDLHAGAFPVGMCARTVFGKAEIVLWRTGADTFRIEVARSYAPYVWACLEEARREFLI